MSWCRTIQVRRGSLSGRIAPPPIRRQTKQPAPRGTGTITSPTTLRTQPHTNPTPSAGGTATLYAPAPHPSPYAEDDLPPNGRVESPSTLVTPRAMTSSTKCGAHSRSLSTCDLGNPYFLTVAATTSSSPPSSSKRPSMSW